MAERDFITATRDRVVVFDGGMGATLEQFDLTQEDYGGLQGKCHEALVLNRPDVIQSRPRIDDRSGRRGGRDRLVPGLPPEARRVGPGRAHARDQPQAPRRSRARRSAMIASSPGSIGPTGFLPSSDDPTLGDISFRKLVEVFAEQARGLVEGGADLIIIETAQDILEVKAADLRRARGVQGHRAHAADPDLGLASSAGRQDAPRHRHRRRSDDAPRAGRRRDRAQLLDRPRGHAGRHPLPRRELAAARPLHPERRPAAAGSRRRDDLP